MPLLEQVLEQYPNQVKLVYKNFPLLNHKFAKPAASAALAAGEQGKFWEFHDKLFENHSQLNDKKIREIAAELGLDVTLLDASMKTRKITSHINRDIQEAQRVGVRGTPTVFINGRRLQDRSIQGFQAMVEKELSKKGKPQGSVPRGSGQTGPLTSSGTGPGG